MTDLWEQTSTFSFSPKPSHSSAISISKKQQQYENSFDNSFQNSFQNSFENSFENSSPMDNSHGYYLSMTAPNFTPSLHQMNQFSQTQNIQANSYDSKTLKYGTKPCIFFMQNGYCKKGDHCTFSHDLSVFNTTQHVNKTFISVDKLYRTKPCKYFFETGVCRKGEHCNFSHDLSLKERYLRGEFE